MLSLTELVAMKYCMYVQSERERERERERDMQTDGEEEEGGHRKLISISSTYQKGSTDM